MKTYTKPDGTIAVTIALADGKQCTVSTGCTDPADAKAVMEAANLKTVEVLAKANQLSRDLLRKLTVKGSVLPGEALRLWSQWLTSNANSDQTSQTYIKKVNVWYFEQAPDRLGDITDTQLSAWLNADDGNKLSTRRIKLAALRSFFGYCAAKDWLHPDPSRTVRVHLKNLTHEQKEGRKKVPMSDDEVAKVTDRIMGIILATHAKRFPKYYERSRIPRLWFWWCAIKIGRLTGLRFGDICNLQWKCFNADGSITVWTDKADKRLVIPITPELHEALRAIPPGDGIWCFTREHKLERDLTRRTQLCNEFKAHLKGAGVDTTHTFHDLRHTRATELYQKGMLPQDIAKALGHSSPGITLRYIHPEAIINARKKEEPATQG